MNITNCKCKNKSDQKETWMFELDGTKYIYSTFKPFMTITGRRIIGQTYVMIYYPKPGDDNMEVGKFPKYLPLSPNAPEKSIERFYQLLLLS